MCGSVNESESFEDFNLDLYIQLEKEETEEDPKTFHVFGSTLDLEIAGRDAVDEKLVGKRVAVDVEGSGGASGDYQDLKTLRVKVLE